MELRRVELSKLGLMLGRFRQIPESAVRAMEESLRTKGQLSPVVASVGEDRALVLVDGFVRLMAARRLGLESLLVEVVEVSAVQMKVQLYVRNRERGHLLIEECRLVRELVEVDGLDQVAVGDFLERHKSWVCRRLALVRQVSPHLLSEAELGLLSGGCLRKLAQLPARNQEELWAAGRRSELGSTDMGELIDLWRRAPDSEARRFVLAQPVEALRLARGRPVAAQDLRLGAAGEEVRRALEVLRRTSLRLVRRLCDGLGEVAPEGRLLLTEAHKKAEADCLEALGALGQYLASGGGR